MAVRRILLDSNVWRYCVDRDEVDRLAAAVARLGCVVQVAPAVLYEALRTRDTAVRRRLVEAMCRRAWRRLMPEVFDECEELKQEIVRLRPAWRRRTADARWAQQLALDWMRPRGGFWDRVRQQTSEEAALIDRLGGAVLEAARRNAQEGRRSVAASRLTFHTLDLERCRAVVRQGLPGLPSGEYEAWRLAGEHTFRSELLAASPEGNAYHEWVGPFVDLDAIQSQMSSWRRFWAFEVLAERMPRCWMRWAVETVQLTRRVTDGTPVDAQLATYTFDSDVFFSADVALIEILSRVRSLAPKPFAATVTVRSDVSAADQIVHAMRSGVQSNISGRRMAPPRS